jgi:prevent-host-death family protein
MELDIRPSADLRNHYNEISKQCHETRKPVIITKNGRGDTAVIIYAVVDSRQEYRNLI